MIKAVPCDGMIDVPIPLPDTDDVEVLKKQLAEITEDRNKLKHIVTAVYNYFNVQPLFKMALLLKEYQEDGLVRREKHNNTELGQSEYVFTCLGGQEIRGDLFIKLRTKLIKSLVKHNSIFGINFGEIKATNLVGAFIRENLTPTDIKFLLTLDQIELDEWALENWVTPKGQ